MVVYSSVRLGVSPQINALATLIVAIVTLCILFAGWLTHRQETQRRRLPAIDMS
jgi:putrescine transport system permease protein